jgi:hypothetical protein
LGVHEETVRLPRYRLQEGRAARTGSTEDNEHLSRTDQSIEVPENLDLGLLSSSNKSLEQAAKLQRIVAKSLAIELA